jgi:hypothetical protein
MTDVPTIAANKPDRLVRPDLHAREEIRAQGSLRTQELPAANALR